MPRLRAVRTLTLTALVAATLLSPVAAHAAEPTGTLPADDWRATACTQVPDLGRDGPPQGAKASGPSTLVASDRVPVEGLPGVLVGVDRLDFSGVACEVFYVDGPLPRDAVVDVTRNERCASFTDTLDGAEQGGGQMCSSTGSPSRLYRNSWVDAPRDTLALAVTPFDPHSSEVVEAGRGYPRSWVGRTLATDHTGSTWNVHLSGTTGRRHDFDRSRATDRAAREAYARKVARITRAFEERKAEIDASHRSLGWKMFETQEARKERRDAVASAHRVRHLALRGVRLVVRDFDATVKGTLPPA